MRDSIDRSLSAFGLLWRLLAGVALVCLVPPVACAGVHNLTHPAPLGRSRAAILRRVDAALPPGTTADSARGFLRAHGVAMDVYSAADLELSGSRDSLLAGGPIVIGVMPAVSRGLYVWDAHLLLYFDRRGQLARRDAQLHAQNPL